MVDKKIFSAILKFFSYSSQQNLLNDTHINGVHKK